MGERDSEVNKALRQQLGIEEPTSDVPQPEPEVIIDENDATRLMNLEMELRSISETFSKALQHLMQHQLELTQDLRKRSSDLWKELDAKYALFKQLGGHNLIFDSNRRAIVRAYDRHHE